MAVIILPMVMGASCSDDDSGTSPVNPTPRLSITDESVVEGDTYLFAVSLDRAAPARVTFSYATSDVTAQAGSDYTAASGSDTIAAGQQSATIMVMSTDDTQDEINETFALRLSSVRGASVADSVGIGTIVDNDNLLVSFATQVQPLLRTSCANVACHGGSLPGGNLYLGTQVTYDTLINATGVNTFVWLPSTNGKIVQPGNSPISTLYLKTTSSPPFPSRMPQTGGYLTTAQQNLIRDWIDQGASDN